MSIQESNNKSESIKKQRSENLKKLRQEHQLLSK